MKEYILHGPGQYQGLPVMGPPAAADELRVTVTPVAGTVHVDFGRAVWWLTLTPEMARKLSDDLLSAASRAATIILAP